MQAHETTRTRPVRVGAAEATRALRRARVGAGLSQAELARQLGVTPSTVGRWESDGLPPQARYRAPLARALGLDLDELCRHWGLGDRSRSNVIPLMDGPSPSRAASAEERARFLSTVMAGLEAGHAANQAWVRVANETARALGLDWAVPLP